MVVGKTSGMYSTRDKLYSIIYTHSLTHLLIHNNVNDKLNIFPTSLHCMLGFDSAS